jgi:hypothetical protein
MEDYNPFIVKNYIGPEYFCDRHLELKKLEERFRNQRNTTLSSNRRMGKTGLIYHFFNHIFNQNSDIKCIYIDLFATQNLSDFIKILTKEVAIKLYSKPNVIIKNFKSIFKSVSPLVTFDTFSGLPQVEFKFNSDDEKLQSIDQIFTFLNNQSQRIIIAFNEFQQVADYPEKNTEALLRTHIQNLHNINFIFSGSHKHLLLQMFGSSQRPFYQSTDFLFLNAIDKDLYKVFIIAKMAEGKKKIHDEALEYIMQFTRIHTYYVQSLCNRLYNYSKKEISLAHTREVADAILEENEDFYISYRNLLPEYQWNLLYAIAKEQGAEKLTSKHFITTYKLNTQGTIQRALAALIDKDMIFEENDKYYVQDVFLSRWLERM